MIVFESKRSRRIVLRLERGEDVVSSVESLAERERIGAAWVRGIGTLRWVELDRHDQARRVSVPPQRFDTPCEILTLEGNVSMLGGAPRAVLHATLARRTDNGVDVLGGRVRAGEVFSCELLVDCLEDLTLTRARDERTGLALWSGESDTPATTSWTAPREEPEEARAPAAVSWADVAAVSAAPPVEPPRRESRARPASEDAPRRPSTIPDQRKSHVEEMLEEPHPQKGDFIEHRQFGLCKVDREDEDGGLMIRLPSGVRKTIKLDFMEVGQPRMEGTRRVFPVRPRRR